MTIQEIETISEQVKELSDTAVMFLVSSVAAGFMIGTLFALAAYGIFKAISLLGIKNITK